MNTITIDTLAQASGLHLTEATGPNSRQWLGRVLEHIKEELEAGHRGETLSHSVAEKAENELGTELDARDIAFDLGAYTYVSEALAIHGERPDTLAEVASACLYHAIEIGAHNVTKNIAEELTTLLEAVPNAAKIIGTDELGGDGVWESFTCIEIEALVQPFIITGCQQAADTILYWHAQGDDEDDQHFHLKQPPATP